MKNKKAMGFGFVTILIIGLVFLIIMIVFVGKLGKIGEEESAKTICKTDVIQKYNTYTKIFRLFESGEIGSEVNCPTQDITIKDNLGNEQGQTSAKSQIANLMYDCLDQFGQIGDNKMELFSTKKGVDAYCVICDLVEFKDKSKEVKGLIPYLDQTKIPNQDKTYMQVLSGYQTKLDLTGFEQNVKKFVSENNVKEIDTNEKYAVTFIYYKEGYLGKFRSTLIGGAAGTGGGVLIVGVISLFTGVGTIPGAIIIASSIGLGTYAGYTAGSPTTADWKSGVMLVPYKPDELKELRCSYLPAKQT